MIIAYIFWWVVFALMLVVDVVRALRKTGLDKSIKIL
jgi:hypothetical protein